MTLTDPVPPGHGEPQLTKVGEAERTYAVVVVYGDGNPQVQSRWGSLAVALKKRDEEKQWHLDHGHSRGSFFVGVEDEDDPERGWIEEE